MQPLSLLLTTYLTLTLAAPTHPKQPQLCNGHASLCHRKYSNITFIGAHDSPFVGPPTNLASNQNVDVTAQLDAGIRFLSAQANKNTAGDLHLCHTYCWEYDAGPLTTYLATIKTWLDANPNEVVTLLLVNGGFYNVSDYDSAFQTANLANQTYRPPTPSTTLTLDQWPSLAQLIANSTRLITFMDYDANPLQVPYILPEFTYFFETPYDTTDPTFPECSINRPPNTTNATGLMIGMNHFLDVSVFGTSLKVPDNGADAQTNAAQGVGSIGAQAQICEGLYGRRPNFVLVDRFNTGAQGGVFEAQMRMNSLGT